MPEPLFSELYRDTEHLVWAPVEQVRRRGRQRTRRTRIAAVLACAVAVAVVASGAVALADRPDATPPLPPATVNPTTPEPTPQRTADPTPSGSPDPSGGTPSSSPPTSAAAGSGRADRTIPAAATLQLADLPKGFTMKRTNGGGDWTLEAATAHCDGQVPALTVGVVATTFVQFDSATDWLVERVTRHSGTGATTSLQRVRGIATGCEPDHVEEFLAVLGEGPGEDDWVLVAGQIKGIPSRWLFVRRGDLLAQLRLDHKTTPNEARSVANRVADRLCLGTDAC
ncbi:hypothetical protein ACIBPB_28315 [Micromonospora sp. NPDC049836]|uniref:hypothetical protein n=1 Tax=Micromonospora sp. NPDC049836 TaxID=3364274 RepID=UPI0037B7C6C4